MTTEEVQTAAVPTENKFSVSASTLSEVFSYANTLVDEITFEIDSDGWKVRSMDPSHIALLDIFVPKTYLQLSTDFEYPEINGSYAIGLHCDEVVNLLKTFKAKGRYSNDRVTVTIDKTQNKFIVSNESTTQSISMIEAGRGSCPLPKINFNAEFNIDGETFLSALQSVEKASEYVTMKLSEPKYINEEGYTFTLEGKGDRAEVVNTLKVFEPVLKTDTSTQKVNISNDVTAIIKPEKDQSATYSLDRIMKQIKIMKATGFDLKIQFSTKMPLLITFQDKDVHFYTAFYLAPRVQD